LHWNALIYGDGEISYTIAFGRTTFDELNGFDKSSVTLQFENAGVGLGYRGGGTGLAACGAAANAVGGEFFHNRDLVLADQSVPFKATVMGRMVRPMAFS